MYSKILEWLSNLDQRRLMSWSFALWCGFLLLAHHAWVPGMFIDGLLYSSIAQTAAERENWILASASPYYYDVFLQHPPLVFIIQGIIFKVFGSEWSVIRITSSIFTLLNVGVLSLFFNKFKIDKKYAWGFFAIILYIACPPVLKKTRSLNLDFPLAFFILCGLYFYLKLHVTKLRKYWPLVGIMFGFALLTKGPPAAVLPLTILVHSLLNGSVRDIFKPIPIFSLLLGFALFSIWPLTIHFLYDYDVISHYFKAQVINTVVEGRAAESLNLFEYPIYLTTQTGPIFLLSLWGLYICFKERRENQVNSIFLALYLTVLIPFSFVRHKYSHYLVPIYPALAFLAARPLLMLKVSFQNGMALIFKGLFVLAISLLLILPLTTKSRRDVPLIKMAEILDKQPGKAKSVINVGGSYPQSNFSGYMAYRNKEAFFSRSINEFSEWASMDNALIISENELKNLENTANVYGFYKKVAFIEKQRYWVLLGNNIFEGFLIK